MQVEEVPNHIEPMHRRRLSAEAVFFSGVIHGIERNVVVLQDFVEFGAVREKHVVIGHPMVDEKGALEIWSVVEYR